MAASPLDRIDVGQISLDNLGYLNVGGSRGSFVEGVVEAGDDFVATIPRPRSIRDSILDDDDVTALKIGEALNHRTSESMLQNTTFDVHRPATNNASSPMRQRINTDFSRPTKPYNSSINDRYETGSPIQRETLF